MGHLFCTHAPSFASNHDQLFILLRILRSDAREKNMKERKNRKLYVISKCLKSKKKYSEMFFNGFISGKKVDAIHINEKLTIGKEYIVEINDYKIENSILIGQIHAFKDLFKGAI